MCGDGMGMGVVMGGDGNAKGSGGGDGNGYAPNGGLLVPEAGLSAGAWGWRWPRRKWTGMDSGWPLAVWRVWIQSLAALASGSVGPPWQQRVASMWGVISFGHFCSALVTSDQRGGAFEESQFHE